MKRKFFVALVLTLLFASTAVAAMAHGQTADTLTKAGWTCVNTGPRNWTHCFKPGFTLDAASQIVKVFSVDGHTYLGTELLLRDDLYQGQPCPQEGADHYHLLPASQTPFTVDYQACHHFETPPIP